MKKAIYGILSIALIIIGIKAALFFYHYDRIPYHDLYIVPSIFVIAGGVVLGQGALRRKDMSEAPVNMQEYLIKNGEKVTVDLSTCSIVPNIPAIEIDKTHHIPFDMNAWDLAAVEKENTANNEYLLLFELPVNGEIQRFKSEVIRLEKITIAFKLTNQKTTTLYLDPIDSTRYHVDLDFLPKN